MNGKGVFQLRDMIGSANCAAGLPDGRYVRAVPEPFWFGFRGRFSGAWEVICGRAFPTEWPKSGDLEKALGVEPWTRRPATCGAPAITINEHAHGDDHHG